MNNADTPAMPLPVPNMFDGMSKDQIKYALALLCGLTKREHFAAMARPFSEMIIPRRPIALVIFCTCSSVIVLALLVKLTRN